MRDRVFGWSYPAGAENDPMAPYNQDSYEDECIEYQVKTFQERLTDGVGEPDAWISEGITQQAGEKQRELYDLVKKNLRRGHRIPEDDLCLGKWVRELVEFYATPSDAEAYDAVTEELANKMADSYYED